MSALYPWLTPVWQDLLKRQQNGLPHALLFTGLKGVGKHALSAHLAQWLLCQNARIQQLTEPCGQCHSCNLWRAGSHPDFLECTPEEGSRQIRIDGVRRLNDFLAQTPQIGRCQVVVLRPADVMNMNAANALLKTLEEPAGESYLLLETERFGSVLPTIRSRCQRVALPIVSLAEAHAWLVAQGQEADAALTALQMYPGAPLAALAWLTADGGQQQQWFDTLADWGAQRIDLIQAANQLDKTELLPWLKWFYVVLVDATKASLAVDQQWQNLQGSVQNLLSSATLDRAKLLTLHAKVQRLLGQLLSGQGNHNKQLLIETLLLEWRAAISAQS